MRKKLTIAELRTQLVFAQEREVSSDFIERQKGRDDVKRIKAAIARKLRHEAYTSVGLVRNRDGSYE